MTSVHHQRAPAVLHGRFLSDSVVTHQPVLREARSLSSGMVANAQRVDARSSHSDGAAAQRVALSQHFVDKQKAPSLQCARHACTIFDDIRAALSICCVCTIDERMGAAMSQFITSPPHAAESRLLCAQ